MKLNNLETIIQQHINLGSPSSSGWHPVLCKICNDRGHKGKRAGFKFENGETAYHCFNCDHATSYKPDEHNSMPKKMVTVLDSFFIPQDEWQQVLFANLAFRDEHGSLSLKKLVKQNVIEPQEVEFPNNFYYLKDADEDDKWAIITKDYLKNTRGVDPDSYPFMLAKHSSNPSLNIWLRRLIIPTYKNNKLIYWQGRGLVSLKKKYLSPDLPKDRVLYGFDEIFNYSDTPIYVVEGWFDAFAVGGVALYGNKISEAQAEWLNKTKRRKVYIPDRFGDGQLGAEQALKLGWEVSTPDTPGCKDMSEAVQKYGKLYVMKSILDHTASGFEAQINLGVYCKNDKNKSNKKTHKRKR